MPISPARKVAFETLLKIERGHGCSADLIQIGEKRLLKDRDRRLAAEIVLGTLRWRGELDFQIERLAHRRLKSLDVEVLAALRMALYQLRFLSKVPRSAAVNEAVELVKVARKRSAAGLVNAALRKAPSTLATKEEIEHSALRAYPAWLIERWRKHFGDAATRALAWAGVQTPRTALRVLGGKENIPLIQKALAAQGIRTRTGNYSPTALVVESGRIAESASFMHGRAVIQDEASQLVVPLLAAQPGQRVLDIAAAPGIKTSQIAAAMGHGLLVAGDERARRLRTATRLWPQIGCHGPSPRWVRLDATRPLPFSGHFDRILADVPCSGTGTLARNPDIKWRLRQQDLTRLARIQSSVLRHALPLLAPGGRLVYATCSLEREENEGVVESTLSRSDNIRRLSQAEMVGEFPWLASLFDSSGYFHTRPDLHGTDGFFAAVLTRTLQP